MFILLLLIGVSTCQHTKTFTEKWNITHNDNYYFYDSETFGMDFQPCEDMSYKKFKMFIDENVNCEGIWCMGYGYLCKNNDTDCYQPDYIISSELEEYNKDIMANMVLSYGKWNFEIKKLLETNYSDSLIEKEIVYTNERVSKAREWIKSCHIIKRMDKSISIVTIIFLPTGIFIAIIIVSLYKLYVYCKKK